MNNEINIKLNFNSVNVVDTTKNLNVKILMVKGEKGDPGSLSNNYGTSSEDGYSQDYLNDKLVNVGTSVDSNYRTNILYSHNLLIEGFRQGNTNDLTNGSRIFTINSVKLEANQTYTISTDLNTTNFLYYLRLGSSPFPSNADVYSSGQISASSIQYTPTTDCYLGIMVSKANTQSSLTPSDVSGVHFQVELGNEATTYTSYLTPSINIDGKEIYKYNPIKTIWTGANHTYNDTFALKEQLEIGALYLIEMMAFSSSYRYYQEFMYVGYGDLIQINYSSFPDNLYVRYRIEAVDSSNLIIKDVKGTAGNNTNITNIYRIK